MRIRALRVPALSLASMALGCVQTSTITPAEPAAVVSDETESQCARATMGNLGPYRMPLADPVTDPQDMDLLADFPWEARRTARAAGLEQLLVGILRENLAARDEPSTRLLSMEEELSLRLMAFETQLLAATFEVHCTAGHVQDVIDDLDEQERHRQFTLAIASLVAGGAAATASGVWTLADPENTRGPAAVSIGGGLTVAGLSIATLAHPDVHVRLIHQRNLLEPVWRGVDTEHLYPSFVFRMLLMAEGKDEPSPRAALTKKWISGLQKVAGPSHNIADRTMYGSGGDYSRALVEERKAQYDGLLSALQSIGRELELFNRYLVGRITPPPPSAPKVTPLTPPPASPTPSAPGP
jgi:hypothetical protein